jgi:L-fucose isomerase-like protein
VVLQLAPTAAGGELAARAVTSEHGIAVARRRFSISDHRVQETLDGEPARLARTLERVARIATTAAGPVKAISVLLTSIASRGAVSSLT